jgi:hypothetical protein
VPPPGRAAVRIGPGGRDTVEFGSAGVLIAGAADVPGVAGLTGAAGVVVAGLAGAAGAVVAGLAGVVTDGLTSVGIFTGVLGTTGVVC